MFRFSVLALQLIELFVSSVVHLLYGFYIFSSAVAGDVSLALNAFFFKSNIEESIRDDKLIGSDNDLPPIVLVHGIFGFGKGRLGGLSYFAGAEKKDENVLVPDLGSLTSIYDRARELFYYLKGGQVDYGEEHSQACGHSQFGRIYEKGHFPQWDEDHPIHFVGHSAGAQVIRVLQQMLADKAFKGYENTSENWVLSVTTLSGAFNGTTRAYLDGMQPDDGKSMKSVCLLQLLRVGVIVYDWIDIPILKYYYNFGFDHYNMSWKKAGIWGLVDCLLGNSGPFAAGDWILPDLTIQGDEEWWDNDGALNTVSMTHPRFPVEHPNRFVVEDSECHPLQPGIWYYKIVEGITFFS